MLTNEAIEIESGTLYVQDEIMCLRIKKDVEIDVHHAKEGLEIRVELQQGKPMLALVDSRDMLNMTRDARAFIADFEKKHNLNIALAILSDSLATNIVANFFIKFNKPVAPTKIFKTEKQALEWLEQYR